MITSVHHYELADSADESDVRAAVAEAEERGLFEDVPALVEYRFGRGIRGTRLDRFAAVWTYEDREAWADVWGSVGAEPSKADYPEPWRVWEDELLDPILAGDPDAIDYTTYEVFAEDRVG